MIKVYIYKLINYYKLLNLKNTQDNFSYVQISKFDLFRGR